MPSKNIVREFTSEAYYHVYNRGVEKRDIFLEDIDYTVFLGLLKKYLIGDTSGVVSKNRHPHKIFGDELQLLSYCLMPNHFHLLLYQHSETAVSDFMRRISVGYSMYFNDKYDRVGSLFQGRFKASQINADAYLQHITRYIHLNPHEFESWPYSSWQYYKSGKQNLWLSKEPVLDLFNDLEEYKQFVRDYETTQKENEILKWQLAHDVD